MGSAGIQVQKGSPSLEERLNAIKVGVVDHTLFASNDIKRVHE
ncbi:hypothetical protein [Cytobacillus praedii]|nr:hypothetical protein [Cytobacillus praedii]